MSLHVIEAQSKAELKRFLEFPYQLYHNNPYWVPPLRMEQRDWILRKNTPLFRGHPSAFFLVERDGVVQARASITNDLTLNKAKDSKVASIALLEYVDDAAVVDLLMGSLEKWTRSQGLNRMMGPVSPTKGDDVRGMLIWGGFEERPVLMNVWNPEYYIGHMERNGFEEHTDLVAYHMDLTQVDHGEKWQVLKYAQKRYGFTIDALNKRDIPGEARDIRIIVEKSLPDWFDLIPPTEENILEIAYRLKRFADPGLVLIARDKDRNPIGFNLAMPDFNEVFQHLDGKLGPLGFLKVLYYRRQIKGARSFVMFVVPEWQKKGVSYGLYLTGIRHAKELGYTYGEGSTIGKWNTPMRRDAEKVGGRHYRTYRIWGKDL